MTEIIQQIEWKGLDCYLGVGLCLLKWRSRFGKEVSLDKLGLNRSRYLQEGGGAQEGGPGW